MDDSRSPATGAAADDRCGPPGDDLGGFLASCEAGSHTEVLRISEQVPIEYVVNQTVFELENRRQYPVLVFEDVENYGMPVVTNVFATRERIARSVGVEESEFYEAWTDRTDELGDIERRSDGPVKSTVEVDEPDLTRFPAPLHFEGDGGRYITAGIVVAKHPETGVGNLSFARIQLKEPAKAGISIHSRGDLWEYVRQAEEMDVTVDVAVIVGAHPSVYVGASSNQGIDVDEYRVVSAIRQEPLEVVPCETVDLVVPSAAEIVVEGTIDPHESEPEGPFGEYTGVMSGRSSNNVLRVSAITRRDQPRFLSITPGRSSEHLQLGRAPKEPTIYRKIKDENPCLESMHFPSTSTHYHCFLSIDKTQPGQPQQTILSALGAWRYIKLAIVVDTDVDVTSVRDVLWAVATRVQAEEDVFVVPRATANPLDPSSMDGQTDKMGIDATADPDSDAERLTVPEESERLVRELLSNYDV
jgi:UbiD family decarboxylase